MAVGQAAHFIDGSTVQHVSSGNPPGQRARRRRGRLASPGKVDEALRRWAAVSGAAHARPGEEWRSPLTRTVVEAILTQSDPAEAVEGLGVACSDSGLTLREAVTDLRAGVAVLPRSARRHLDEAGLILALTEGWAEGWTTALLSLLDAQVCVDVLTGLATRQYLEARLDEMYALCRAIGARPGDAYALVVVDARPLVRAADDRLARRVQVARSLRDVFSSGETAALIAPSVFVALSPITEDLPQRLMRLYHAIEPRSSSGWPGPFTEPLPPRSDDARLVLRALESRMEWNPRRSAGWDGEAR